MDKPPWLETILQDTKPPPRWYAWTVDDLKGTPTDRQSVDHHHHHHHHDNDSAERRVYILGLGNLGRLYAICLSQLRDPPPITLVVHRRSLLEHWAAHPGIEMTRYGVVERVSRLEIEWWTDEKPPSMSREGGGGGEGEGSLPPPVREIADGGRIANLIMATKAPDAMRQVDGLRRYLDESSTVLCIQNGMNRLWPPHGAAYLSHRYPDGRHPYFLHGVTMHGVFSEGPFRSVHAAPADVVIGTVAGPNRTTNPGGDDDGDAGGRGAEYLCRLLTTAPHLAGRVVPRSELWVLQLEKLVVNAIINPLSAILRVRNGELFADPHGEVAKVIEVLLTETSDVLQALVRQESSREILQDGRTQEVLLERFSRSSLREMLYRVGEKVKHNRSSMFQDVEAGKPTEIREFNGWLVETGKFLDQGLDTSHHEMLIQLVEQGVQLDKAELGRRLLVG